MIKGFVFFKDGKIPFVVEDYYNYNSNLNAYIEVLSYDKIILDAQKRNKILFDKLGI